MRNTANGYGGAGRRERGIEEKEGREEGDDRREVSTEMGDGGWMGRMTGRAGTRIGWKARGGEQMPVQKI